MPNKEQVMMLDTNTIDIRDVFPSYGTAFTNADELISAVTECLRSQLSICETRARRRLKDGMVPAEPFVKFYLDTDWEDDSIIRVEYFREQTEEEIEAARRRAEREAAAKARQKEVARERELKEYERLKKKYG